MPWITHERASFVQPHLWGQGSARVARRARQRRRCYQSGKGRATNRGGPGCRQGYRWAVSSGRNRPRPAPRQRPGPAFGLVLLGDPPSFDEDVSDPHCCVKPLDAVALAVACGDRGVSESTWAAGLLFGADGVAVTVSLDRTAGDASLATATASIATTVSASIKDICRVPSHPANVSRGRRLPYAMSTTPAIGRLAHPVDPPPPPVDRAAWRIRAHAGASPAAVPPYSRIAPLRFGTWASPSTSYGCRARTGFPPACWSPSLSGWLPTTPPQGGSNMAATIAPAPRRHQGGTRTIFLAPLPLLRSGPI